MPYVQLLADFRDDVRNVAREVKGKTDFIQFELSVKFGNIEFIKRSLAVLS